MTRGVGVRSGLEGLGDVGAWVVEVDGRDDGFGGHGSGGGA